MSLSDSEILELSALCSALVDGAITNAGRVRLNEWLAVSGEARRFYVRQMALSASLHDYAGEMQTDAPVRVVRGPAKWWRPGAIAAAAALVLGLWLLWPREGAEDEEIVATLSGMTGGTWSGHAPRVGDELRRGQQLHLASGIVEITFTSGAQVTLEGPAAFGLNSAWDAVLHRGSLRAHVPPEAVGFRVANADVEVTDLGTQFSMVAGEKGGTEVFVLEGMVSAAARDDLRPITLRETQARRFDRASKNSEVRDSEQKLKRLASKAKLHQLSRPAGYVHWAFDEPDGAAAKAEVSGIAGHESGGQFTASASAAPRRIDGRRERAVDLDGTAALSAKVPALAGREGATLAFWVRTPEDAALPDSSAMLAWQRGRNSLVQVSWNRNPAQGALGALRVDSEQGYLVGTTPLRDGRWHHVAVVFGSGGKPRHYVDGRLEPVTAKRFKRVKASDVTLAAMRSDLAPHTLRIGLGALARADELGFRGALDELFVTDRALTQLEIRMLQRENRPGAPSVIAAQ